MAGMLAQAQDAAGRARAVPIPQEPPQQAAQAQVPPGPAQPGPQDPAAAMQPGPQGPAQPGAPGPQGPQGPAQAQEMPPDAAAQPTDASAAGMVEGQMPGGEPVEGPTDASDISAHTPDVQPVTGPVDLKTRMLDASEDEQQEYKKALEALSVVLYTNEKSHSTVVQALRATQQDKIDPIAKLGIILINQVDDKVDIDGAVVAQFTQDTTERLIEMAEARYGVEYSEVEAQQALGTTWEGVMASFGIEEKEYKKFMETVHPEDAVTAKRAYQGAIAHG